MKYSTLPASGGVAVAAGVGVLCIGATSCRGAEAPCGDAVEGEGLHALASNATSRPANATRTRGRTRLGLTAGRKFMRLSMDLRASGRKADA